MPDSRSKAGRPKRNSWAIFWTNSVAQTRVCARKYFSFATSFANLIYFGVTTYRNGPKRTGTDRNGPKRTFVDTETDFLGTETDFSGYRDGP